MKRWQTVPVDEAAVRDLADQTGLPQPACQVLVARGYSTPDDVDMWLNPRLSRLSDPFLLPSMSAAVDRLAAAVVGQETVLVYGDYDVDGITSTALMIRVLSALGVRAIPFLPHRVDDGYGLSVEPVERCISEYHPNCIVTVDCGTGSVAAVQRAAELGVDVIVTDHHEPGAELAPALAVVNPKLNGTAEPLQHLAGVGVAFKLCHALIKRLRDQGESGATSLDLRQHLDLVAVGTIADMVPLSDENRILARYGLAELNRTRNIGLAALRDAAGVKGDLDAYHIGFALGPRLNAAGRLGTAQTALELLLSEDADAAGGLAYELDAANRDRQQIEAKMVEQAMRIIDGDFQPQNHFGLVVAHRDWHPGVIGIVASRLCARYSRPSIVIAIDDQGVGRGSCRSISAYNIVAGLTQCADVLERFGGHAMAAGLQIAEDRVGEFRERFNQAVQQQVQLDDLRPVQRIDGWLSLRDADWPLVECLERMMPFGLGNPRPVWGIRGARLLGEPRVVGRNHLKLTVLEGNQKLDAIAFNMADREIPSGPLDVAFQLNRNSFAGRETIQMNVQDIVASAAG